MSRAKQWSVRIGGIVVVACAEPIAPTSSPPPVQLVFTMQPTSATAGVAIDPVVAVSIEDASGNTLTSATNTVTVSIGANANGASVTGTTTVAAVHGVATFLNLRILKAGTGYTLKAASPEITATSTPFDITPGPAASLLFTTQPSNTIGGVTISPPIQVAAQDSFGNLATAFGDSVTVALGSNSASGSLSGTTNVKAVHGTAIFGDLSIAPMGTKYTLTASAGGLTGASSAPFAIIVPATLHITAVTTGPFYNYGVCLDLDPLAGCGAWEPIGPNSAVTMTVDSGVHTIVLGGGGVCTVAGDNPRSVHAVGGETTEVRFDVACIAVPLHVTTTTTGASLDPDGYLVCVDLDPWQEGCAYDSAIGVNGGTTLPVAPGPHVVQLVGVAGNCTVSGDNPRTVTANADTEVPFAVTCTAAGSVRVTTATTGLSLDPSYLVCIDRSGNGCFWYVTVGANDTVAIPAVTPGPHRVALTDVAGNCTISGPTPAPLPSHRTEPWLSPSTSAA